MNNIVDMKKLIKIYNISFMYNFFVDLRKRVVKVMEVVFNINCIFD